MYQKIIVVGYLGGDPEMRYMPDGTAVTNFSLATSRRWNAANGEQRDETTWFRVSVWRQQAETTNQDLSKGQKVLVEGRIRPDPQTGNPRLWTRQDGSVAASFEITADTVRFLSGREDNSGGSYDSGDDYNGTPAQEEDDIPF
jgi:single-strand DNA-binding protein